MSEVVRNVVEGQGEEERCRCEGACNCGLPRGSGGEEDGGSSGVAENSDSEEERVLDGKEFRQHVPEGMAAETLAIMRKDGVVVGGRRADPKDFATGGPVVPPWMNDWANLDQKQRF